MDPTYLWILGMTALLGAGGAAGMRWAARTGRLRQLESGARAVFTDDEPEGRVLDRFPQAKAGRKT
jgi:hypothetical protein